MSQKVEDYFIQPMVAHFESEPTEGVRETLLNDMEEYAAEDLMTAVAWLKRARQSVKTFPSPKECIKAIKAVVGGRSKTAVGNYGRVQITAQTYGEACSQFCAGMEKVPVIVEGTPQWEAWHAYWKWLGAKWLLDLVRDRKSWTVPTEFPSMFDPRFGSKLTKAA